MALDVRMISGRRSALAATALSFLLITLAACGDDPADTPPGGNNGGNNGDNNVTDTDTGHGGGDEDTHNGHDEDANVPEPDANPGDEDATGDDEDANPGDEDANPGDEDVQDDPQPEPISFATVYSTVIRSCTGCHGSNGDLSLSSQTVAYNNLVNVEAKCGNGNTRVVPFNPEASLFWTKVAPGVVTCGGKMGGANGLPAAQAELIYDWIAGGALP
jgi:hypothetical protein